VPYDNRAHAADVHLAERDPALPGLRTLLDPAAFASELSAVLPERVERVYPAYVRYKPAVNCLVSYRVETATRTYQICAKAHRRGDHEKLAKATARRSSVIGGHIVVSIFPVDAKLKSLRRLADGQARHRLLSRLLPGYPDSWSGDVRELRYKPERRYVAKLEVDDVPAAALKMFTPAGYEAACRGSGAFASGDSLRIPRCLGRSDRHRVLAYEWLPGFLLSERLTSGLCSTDGLRRVGVALAELHGQTADELPRLDLERELARLTDVAAAVGFIHPRLTNRVAGLAERIGRDLGEQDPVYSPVHGDFYAKQVLLQNDRVAVLDFDESAIGDPATDIGNFVAHLERDVLRGRMDQAAAVQAKEALLDGYASVADRPSTARVRLYTARCLFALAPHPFRFREADWPEATEALIRRSEAILDAGPRPRLGRRSGSHPGVEDTLGVREDPAFHFLTGALQLDRAEEKLLPLSGRLDPGGGSLVLQKIRVLRHKPGRRCLVEYDFGTLRMIGKVRARGLDSDTYALCGHLYRSGFGPSSIDRISTPEPVGCVPEWNMWLQRRVPGLPATDLLTGPEGRLVARRIARGLHKLNDLGPPTRRRHTMSDELRILHEKLPLVASLNPRWSPRIRRILAQCERLGASMGERPLQPIHRDLHAGNVVVDGNRTYILDLDLYTMGDPALDAGNFIGHLTELAIRRTGDPLALRDLEQAFENAFVRFAGEARREDVRSYATLTLVRHIYISTLFETRRSMTGALIALCEKRLSVGRDADCRPIAGVVG